MPVIVAKLLETLTLVIRTVNIGRSKEEQDEKALKKLCAQRKRLISKAYYLSKEIDRLKKKE